MALEQEIALLKEQITLKDAQLLLKDARILELERQVYGRCSEKRLPKIDLLLTINTELSTPESSVFS